MSKPRPPIPWFTVWRLDTPSGIDGGHAYSSPDARMAAQVHAAYFHRHGNGAAMAWPLVFYVRDDASGQVYEVDVQRVMLPEFTAGEARKVR